MEILELLAVSDNEDITDLSQTLYQQKVGSLLFAAIAIRPNLAFAVLRLSRFNQRPVCSNQNISPLADLFVLIGKNLWLGQATHAI